MGETHVEARFLTVPQTEDVLAGAEDFVSKTRAVLEGRGVAAEMFEAIGGLPEKGDRGRDEYESAVARLDAKLVREELDEATRPGSGVKTGIRI